jgi:hypothetical protein
VEDGAGTPSVRTLECDAGEPFEPALRRAAGAGDDWLLVCDRALAPRGAAADALLAAVGRVDGLPAPVLLAAVVVDRAGAVDDGRAAWYRRAPTELAMAAAERRLLPIRAAAGPVLVRAEAASATPPRASAAFEPGELLEWTARLLRDGAGYLVPQSEYTAPSATRDPALRPLTAARLLAGTAFAGTDRLRVAAELFERARRRGRPPAS